MRKVETELVRGGVTLTKPKKGRLEKVLDRSLVGLIALTVSGLVYVATHTEEEMNKVRGAVMRPLELLCNRLDEMHRKNMNNIYGEGYSPITTRQQYPQPETVE